MENTALSTDKPTSNKDDGFSCEPDQYSPFIDHAESCLTKEGYEEIVVTDESLHDQYLTEKELAEEGGLPTNREEVDASESDSGKNPINVSATDLFKMLA